MTFHLKPSHLLNMPKYINYFLMLELRLSLSKFTIKIKGSIALVDQNDSTDLIIILNRVILL
jgi:hypothetical protein